jgi:hypothetical protein
VSTQLDLIAIGRVSVDLYGDRCGESARNPNSSHETKTESIRELAQQQVQQIDDFDFLIRAVVSSVLPALRAARVPVTTALRAS